MAYQPYIAYEQPGSVTWRRLALDAYAAQSVTLSGVLIRTALGILAPPTTSMIAAIVLERRGVALDALLPISITRYSNSGALSLIHLFLSPSTLGGFYTFLITLLFLLTLAAQFSSTLLVLDLQPVPVMNFSRTVTFPYSANMTHPNVALSGDTLDYYKHRPDVFGIFAEYSEPTATETDGVDDTGATVRALLPLTSQPERERVRNFQGMAKVLDARVACVRPELTDVRVCGSWSSENWPVYQLCGSVRSGTPRLPDKAYVKPSSKTTPPEQGLHPLSVNSTFQCDIVATQWSEDRRDHDWALCMTSGVQLASMLSNATAYGEYYPQIAGSSRSMVVLNARDIFRQLQEMAPYGYTANLTRNGTWTMLDAKAEGPWTHQQVRYTPPDKSPQLLSFKTSWCSELVADGPVRYMNITASTDRHSNKEPSYQFDGQADTFDTTLIREQLGATSTTTTTTTSTSSQRQILTLSKSSLDQSLASIRGKPLNASLAADRYIDSRVNLRGEHTILLQPWAIRAEKHDAEQAINIRITDSLLSAIFAAALDDTSSPARAIQAFRFTQARMIYYDALKAFSGNLTSAEVDEEILVLAPAARAGFLSVMGIIAAHVVLFVLVLVLFLRESRWSFLEQAWSAVGQVASHADAQGLLLASSAVTDDDVARWVSSSSSSFPDADAGQPRRRRMGTSAVGSLVQGVRGLFVRRPGPAEYGFGQDVRYQVKDGVVVKTLKHA
ncbi:uncharacterized protein B0I36DRAFT_434616 [Microdochium trichocladiopsis]|uniref:Uncharacterized protein n=1 Tax=Microdochium trichocladiopsis TaxID=1682393 RepID=A0A9P9BM57_9PEZI|nr:uncharacterized protein B0I36DRAFT_434616 [Microdochium trichocladiopsis]KAH7025120.1 hypothetical protein B0I36DRAFT_434616 [Microdochium trichocladiopsis]